MVAGLSAMGKPMPAEQVGDRIRRARFQAAARSGRAVTQTALAKAVGVTPGAVSQWENGTTEPNLSVIPKLAHALGVSPGWLAFGEDGPELINPATDRKLTDEEVQRARDTVAAARASKSAAAKRNHGKA